jgi:hypothetical protein
VKAISLFSILIVILCASSSNSAVATSPGFAAGTFDGDFTLQVRQDLLLGGDISQITGQASVYFMSKTKFGLDADYHFNIKSGSGRFYPLAGFHFAFNSNDTEFGANGGAGLNFRLTRNLAAFVEGKYVFFASDSWAMVIGVYF